MGSVEGCNYWAERMFDQADTVVVNTGNIINSYSLNKRVGQKISEEVADSVKNAFSAWTVTTGPDSMLIPEPAHTLDVSNSALTKIYSEERRQKLKISVKIFLKEWRPESARKAIQNVCKSLGVSNLDYAILSLPETISGDDIESVFGKVMEVWKEMESMVEENILNHIGVTDFDTAAMSELYQCANVKPTIDQLRSAYCYNLPEGLEQFSREYDIELLSHDDAPDILPAQSFQNILSENFRGSSSKGQWLPSYVVRYSAVARYRGIVRCKGYIVEAQRRISNGFY